MKKRYFSAGLILACIVIVSLVILSTVASADQKESPSYLWGKIERKYQNEPVPFDHTEAPAIVGEHFSISTNELNHTIDVQKIIDPASAETVAKDLLIQRYSLYYQAEQEGCVVSDEYIDDLIEQEIAMFAEAPNNADYEDFLNGLGMTNEEYWYSCRDMLKMTESIGNWKQKKYDEFISENRFDTSTPEDLDTLWAEHLNELTENIIAQENIRYPDSESPES